MAKPVARVKKKKRRDYILKMTDQEFRRYFNNEIQDNWSRFWAFGAFGVGIVCLILSRR